MLPVKADQVQPPIENRCDGYTHLLPAWVFNGGDTRANVAWMGGSLYASPPPQRTDPVLQAWKCMGGTWNPTLGVGVWGCVVHVATYHILTPVH